VDICKRLKTEADRRQMGLRDVVAHAVCEWLEGCEDEEAKNCYPLLKLPERNGKRKAVVPGLKSKQLFTSPWVWNNKLTSKSVIVLTRTSPLANEVAST